MEYDVVVVGAGHAGLEAAFASSQKGVRTLLITLTEEGIALMPCNPSIGGPAKGVVTREIDALGGIQGIAADENQLQMKLLNSSKGPGVWALRAQVDKVKFHKWFIEKINKQQNLKLLIDEVIEINVEDNEVKGITTLKNGFIKTKTIILTTGTYLESITYRGSDKKEEGPNGSIYAKSLSKNLENLGINLIRLKTGTPPRILKDSIDYSVMQLEPGTNQKLCFSHYNQTFLDFDKQLPCYIIHTSENTHEIIRENLSKSAMYGGLINGIGPRYCPSIEDKIVKFPDKERHQIFVEPESELLNTMYLGGFSTSMPIDVQEKMIRSLPGLENCVIEKYAYAIEYDAIDPTQIFPSLMFKNIKGLFSAGQINGTSGYEEAAGQGIVAGINAANFVLNKQPLILSRTNSYIGVMIDDIVTKGVTEPYRLLTSRAEHRLYLRNDNADERLTKIGYDNGLISDERYNYFQKQQDKIKEIIDILSSKTVGQIDELKFVVKKNNVSLFEYIKRPEIKLETILNLLNISKDNLLTDELIQKIEIKIKFEGYIKLQEEKINQYNNYNDIKLDKINNYKDVPNLSLEAIDKLNKIKPLTLSQAGRVSGITIEDIIKIKYYLERLV